jgi:hypothetical protein
MILVLVRMMRDQDHTTPLHAVTSALRLCLDTVRNLVALGYMDYNILQSNLPEGVQTDRNTLLAISMP